MFCRAQSPVTAPGLRHPCVALCFCLLWHLLANGRHLQVGESTNSFYHKGARQCAPTVGSQSTSICRVKTATRLSAKPLVTCVILLWSLRQRTRRGAALSSCIQAVLQRLLPAVCIPSSCSREMWVVGGQSA